MVAVESGETSGAMPTWARLRSLVAPDAPRARARRDRVLAIVAMVGMVLLMARAVRKEAGVLVLNQEFGARSLAGEDPYFDPANGQRVHGPYPPSYAIVCAPLALLPTRAARLVWSSLQCGALVGLYVLLRRRTRASWPELAPHVPVLFALALLLVSRFLLRDMAAGGGNLLYGTLALLGLELALAGREGRAGLVIALGLIAKPNLAPLLLFYALRGRWRTVISATVLTSALFFAPAPFFGLERYLGLARDWFSSVVAYAQLEELHESALVPDGMPPALEAMNQSLREATYRLVRSPGDSRALDVHFVEVSAHSAAWIARGFSLVLLSLCALSALRARPGRQEWLAAMAFVPLCLLLSPVTWKAHHVALLPVLFGLTAEAVDSRQRWLGWTLAAYYVSCSLLSQELVGENGKNALQAVSVVTWAAVLLMGLCIARASTGPAAEANS